MDRKSEKMSRCYTFENQLEILIARVSITQQFNTQGNYFISVYLIIDRLMYC